jgi:MoaA/NifB/PqqE/SkfB family radical SAM enzyme
MIESPIQSEALQFRTPRPVFDLPPQVCFRVTRFCNARCGFCLAPPDGGVHPATAALRDRIDWLLAHGVKTIHFCGGEPTIHRDLSGLLARVRERGGKSKLTTNGIALSDVLVPALRATRTQVKVSLHGDQLHHDEIVGRDAFRYTTATIQRLLAAGVATSVQTTVVTGHLDVVLWMIRYCLDNKVRRVSFLPFIPRGSGFARQVDYGLTRSERLELRDLIKEKRRTHNARLDIRLLDFNTHPVPVVEPDGRIILEGATEALDQWLGQIPVKAESSAQTP